MRLQIALEDVFIEIAKMCDSFTDIVVICDRGLMDGSAYVTKS
jgi:hypothetical protein